MTLWLLATAPLSAQSPDDAPAANPQYREVRPPAGTGRRGLVSAPTWTVWVIAGVGLIATLAPLARQMLRRHGGA